MNVLSLFIYETKSLQTSALINRSTVHIFINFCSSICNPSAHVYPARDVLHVALRGMSFVRAAIVACPAGRVMDVPARDRRPPRSQPSV